MKVSSDEDVLINLDGELGGKAPVTFKNLKRHIEVFVPIDDIREQDRV